MATITRNDTKTGRFYEIDGHSYPSVTSILGVIGKPALVNWAANQERAACLDAAADLYLDLIKTAPMSRPAYVTTLTSRIGKAKAHKKTSEKAAEIGSHAHALIEWNLRKSLGQSVGPEPRVVDDAAWAFMAFEDWAQSVSLKPLRIEQIVYSVTHEYAGTMDLVAEVHGVPTLIDFKTSKGVYAEAHLQTAAYRHALGEMGHGTIGEALIVRLPKLQTDPAFEVVASGSVGELLPTFLAARQVWSWWYAEEQASRAKWEASRA